MRAGRTDDHSIASHSEGGFSIIEVMVSVLILSVGLLGVAGAQLVSLSQINNSNLRTQATFYAQEVVERSRARLAEDPTMVQTDFEAIATDTKSTMEVAMGSGASIAVNWNDPVLTVTPSWAIKDEGTESVSFQARLRE